nr:restriction endonuclease subunit S [Shimia sp. R9_2]
MPEGWTTVSLGDLLERIEAGKNFRCEERPPNEGEVGIVKISAVTWGNFKDDESKTIGNPEQVSPALRIETGDLLMSRANTIELVGAAVIVGSLTRNLQLSDKVLRLRLAVPIQNWVNRYLNSRSGRDQIESFATGAQMSMRNISQKNIARIELPLPPLREQQQIVEKVEMLFARLDKGEEAVREVQKLLKRYRQSILKSAVTGELTADWRAEREGELESGTDLLARILKTREENWQGRGKYKTPVEPDTTDLPDLPEGWVWASLSQLNVIKGGVTVDKKREPKDPVTLPYLRVANVQNGFLDLGEIKEITVDREKAEQCLLDDGDILLNEGGDLDKLGRGWVWRSEIDRCIHQNHVFRARPVLKELSSEFISLYANGFGQGFFMDKGKQSVNLASISLTAISGLPIPLPSTEEQAELARLLDDEITNLKKLEQLCEAELKRSAALRQSILKDAFSGHLVPQDPDDEPASALLERIQQSKKKRK